MSHLRCPDCGVTVAEREARDSTKPCPRCLMRTGSIVWMEPRTFIRPEPRFQMRGH
jgi:phage FluMu protein Com